MKIESGKYYLDGRGDLRGPMSGPHAGHLHPYFKDQHGGLYDADGIEWDHVRDSTSTLIKEAEPDAADAGRALPTEPQASSRCPMDGIDTPHPHSVEGVIEYLKLQAARFLPPGAAPLIIGRTNVPEGYTLLPLVPTEAMVNALWRGGPEQEMSFSKKIEWQLRAISSAYQEEQRSMLAASKKEQSEFVTCPRHPEVHLLFAPTATEGCPSPYCPKCKKEQKHG